MEIFQAVVRFHFKQSSATCSNIDRAAREQRHDRHRCAGVFNMRQTLMPSVMRFPSQRKVAFQNCVETVRSTLIHITIEARSGPMMPTLPLPRRGWNAEPLSKRREVLKCQITFGTFLGSWLRLP